MKMLVWTRRICSRNFKSGTNFAASLPIRPSLSRLLGRKRGLLLVSILEIRTGKFSFTSWAISSAARPRRSRTLSFLQTCPACSWTRVRQTKTCQPPHRIGSTRMPFWRARTSDGMFAGKVLRTSATRTTSPWSAAPVHSVRFSYVRAFERLGRRYSAAPSAPRTCSRVSLATAVSCFPAHILDKTQLNQ